MNVRVVILTVDGHPSFLVAKANNGAVRPEFVDEICEYLHGRRGGGTKHAWESVDEPEKISKVAAAGSAEPGSPQAIALRAAEARSLARGRKVR